MGDKYFRRPVCFLVFVCTFVFCQAQDARDSLKKIIYSSLSYSQKKEAYLAFGEKYALQNFNEMLQITEEGILFAERNKDEATIGNLKRYTGLVYYFKGDYDLAAKYYYQSISLLEDANQKKNLASSYNELAKLYRKTGALDRASLNYDKALELFTELKDSSGISLIENESGVVYEYKKDYAEAIKRYTTSLNIASLLKDEMAVSYALSNLAGVYTLQEKYADAESFLKHALILRKRLNDSLALALIYSDIAANYYSQKKYADALLYSDTSIGIAMRIHYPELIAANYKVLSDISKEKGNYKAAFNYLEKQTSLRDSLINKEKIKQIEELNTKYETLQREKKIQQQQFEINKRNYWIAGSVTFLFLMTLWGFSYYKRSQLKQKSVLQQAILIQQEMATKAILEAEENERQRIAKDLHDGVGQMMSVAKMNLSALENDLQFSGEKEKSSLAKIISLVDDSCKEVRAVSHNMMPNALFKSNLGEALQTFANQLEHPGLRIQLHTEGLDKKINSNVEIVLYRVIQECVNNVIKHANASVLDISVIKDEDGISATIEDNGQGFDNSSENFTNGIGIKNIKSRIQFLKGTVEFISAPRTGTLVSLHISSNL